MAESAERIAGGVHQPRVHDSAEKHVTGEALYVDDLPEPPGTLQVYVALSPRTHARILSRDLSAVAAAPGVAAVVSAADVPGENDFSVELTDDDPVFADDLVECYGEAVFAVAARTIDQAREAAGLAKIEYEDLAPILTTEDAIKAGAFVADPFVVARGDSAAALEAAPRRLQGRITTGGQEHFYLEGQVSLSIPQEDGDLLIKCSTQDPSAVQHTLARILDKPANCFTVEVRRLGGGFGGKETQATHFAAVAALVSHKTGRPAKVRLDRDDDMIMTGKRNPFVIDYDVGFDDDGLISGLDFTYASHSGMSRDQSKSIMERAVMSADNAYFIENLTVHAYVCKTHVVSACAFRGFGTPQAMLATERVIDAIALELGADPLEVRRRNFYGVTERNVTHYDMVVEDNIVHEVVDDLEASADYGARRAAVRSFNAENRWLKKGFALVPLKYGVGFSTTFCNQAGALLHIYQDGSVHLNHGGTEMGQGLFMKVAQVVAEELQIDLDRIKSSATTTGKVPNTIATAASSGADLNGKAAQAAARTLKERLAGFAAEHFKVPRDQVVFLPNRVRIGNDEMSFGELAELAFLERVSMSATGHYKTPKVHWDVTKFTGRPFLYCAYGAAATEVLIDTLTGETRLTRVDILHDVGASLNPALDLGQVEGGFIQGVGMVTSEEICWDEAGRLTTHAPSTYKIPTCSDRPEDFRVRLLESGRNREETVFNSKAVGEPPLTLAVSAFCAITDAVASVCDYEALPQLDSPATPERVLRAIDELRARCGRIDDALNAAE